jgi:hypothetical protein
MQKLLQEEDSNLHTAGMTADGVHGAAEGMRGQGDLNGGTSSAAGDMLGGSDPGVSEAAVSAMSRAVVVADSSLMQEYAFAVKNAFGEVFESTLTGCHVDLEHSESASLSSFAS